MGGPHNKMVYQKLKIMITRKEDAANSSSSSTPNTANSACVQSSYWYTTRKYTEEEPVCQCAKG